MLYRLKATLKRMNKKGKEELKLNFDILLFFLHSRISFSYGFVSSFDEMVACR